MLKWCSVVWGVLCVLEGYSKENAIGGHHIRVNGMCGMCRYSGSVKETGRM